MLSTGPFGETFGLVVEVSTLRAFTATTTGIGWSKIIFMRILVNK